MDSSDSGEDFESADEDFDPDNSSRCTKTQSEHTSSDNNIGTDVKLAESSVKDLDKKEPIDKFSELRLKENQNTIKHEIHASYQHRSVIEENEIVDANSKTNRTDVVKMKPSSKKLGTKLTGNVNNDSVCSPNVSKMPEVSKRTNEYKSISEIIVGKHVKTENTKQTVASLTETVELKEKSHLPIKNIENEYNWSDGWEIEEEELNVSAALDKSSDTTTSDFDEIKQSSENQEETQGWGGWGDWGVSSLISTASGSVSTFSSQVTAGLSTVLETTVGAPNPEALAAATVKSTFVSKGDPLGSTEDKILPDYGGFGSLVSGVSFLGSTVINRGLDTLESLGKKTMEVLQEGDPGLMKKRAMLFSNQDKPVLSQILREAKEKAENSDKEKEEKETARKAHFESLFDDFHGMVHLEALEMLSTQCELKLQSQMQLLSGEQLTDFQETLTQVRDLCELSDEEENIPDLTQEQFANQITIYVDGLRVNITAAKIIHVNSEIVTRLGRLKMEPATIVNQTAISSLAEFAAAAMECFHKSAELLLAKPSHNTPEEADNYIQLTIQLCARASAIANDFTQLLTSTNPIANSSMITNIFLEASNSCSYIRNACQLLVPILQVGAVSS